MRENGFYWVRSRFDGWIVAEWHSTAGWSASCWHNEFINAPQDDCWDEIDERRIVRAA